MRLSDERWTATALLVAIYAIFIVWFCGPPMAPIPLTEVDAEEYRELFKGKILEEEISPHRFETFMSNDDGSPITVTAKLLFRDEPRYPENTPESVTRQDTVDDAISALTWGMYRLAIPSGTVSMSAMRSPTTLFRSADHVVAEDADSEEDTDTEDTESTSSKDFQQWSVEWTFRVRCRKDFLDLLLAAENSGLWYHKTAAVRAMEISVSQGSLGYHITPTAIIQLLVLLFLLIVYELTELCFPESPDMIELKKLRKKQAKLEKKKEKEKTKEKADTPSRTNSDAK